MKARAEMVMAVVVMAMEEVAMAEVAAAEAATAKAATAKAARHAHSQWLCPAMNLRLQAVSRCPHTPE